MKLTPSNVLEAALRATTLTPSERDDLRDAHASALVLRDVANAPDEALVGGSDGESDCPREVGSRHARPEGLSAGARYLRGGV